MASTGGSSDHKPLSVIMPAYNEEANIEEAVREVQTQVLQLVPGSELVVVDDGSTDQTGAVLDKIAASDNRVIVIHKKNAGHGPALITGMESAAGEKFFLVDSDMQIPLGCFTELWHKAADHDGAFGCRANRQDPTFRLILSKIIRATVMMLFGIDAIDLNAPCKVLRRDIWENFYREIHDETLLAPSLMLNIYARAHKYNIATMPVPHRIRTKGESTLKIGRLLRFCLRGLRQLMHYRSELL